MKKKTRKLALNRETLQRLSFVSGGASAVTICGYTCARLCQPVPSIDYCDTDAIECASQAPPGCPSGIGC